MLRRIIGYQSLISSLFFLANELERTSSLSRLGPVAPDRRLSWKEQHGRLCMCFFVSEERVLRSLPWMSASRRLASEARLLLSQVVDRVGRIEVPPPLATGSCTSYRWVNFESFAKACHGKSFYSGFLLFLEQQRAHKYYSLTKNQERTILPSTTSDRQTARVKRKNVCKSKAWRDGANLKAHIASRSFPREIPVRGRFFERRFQPLSVGVFFSNQRNRLVGAPRPHFCQKLKIDK